MMGRSYFLTGATGFVGRFILRELLRQDPTNHISVLVRESGGESAQTKVDNLLKTLFSATEYPEYRKQVQALEGDVTRKNLGLAPETYHRLMETTNVIFHAAASIEYDLPLEIANQINVEGTRSVLELAQGCLKNKTLLRMNHISTAYVTGKQKSSQLAVAGPEFANTYEESKYSAEKLVGSYIEVGLPVTIHRPSLITGHSVTGEITISNILYSFFVMFSRSLLPAFPSRTDSSLNIVSINYFINLMLRISEHPDAVGKVYNITNRENTNLRALIETGCEALGVPAPQFSPTDRLDLLSPSVRGTLEPFINYIEQSHSFDVSDTRELLRDQFIECDDILASTRKIIEYCFNNRLLKIKKSTGAVPRSQLQGERLVI